MNLFVYIYIIEIITKTILYDFAVADGVLLKYYQQIAAWVAALLTLSTGLRTYWNVSVLSVVLTKNMSSEIIEKQ